MGRLLGLLASTGLALALFAGGPRTLGSLHSTDVPLRMAAGATEKDAGPPLGCAGMR